MPRRNVIKRFEEDAYYHVYNRGVNKRRIFIDDEDYRVFMNLLKRHLTRDIEKNSRNSKYESFAGRVELLSFCLMPNHYHLLFYLNSDSSAITELLRRVAGSYTTYFNKKYERVGHLFEGVYKASRITSDPYLYYISRYIHRNPKSYMEWEYSSLPYYIGSVESDWVVPDRIFKLYEPGTYEIFLRDDAGHEWGKEELRGVLADK